jgi:hypothetical protein
MLSSLSTLLACTARGDGWVDGMLSHYYQMTTSKVGWQSCQYSKQLQPGQFKQDILNTYIYQIPSMCITTFWEKSSVFLGQKLYAYKEL